MIELLDALPIGDVTWPIAIAYLARCLARGIPTIPLSHRVVMQRTPKQSPHSPRSPAIAK